MTPNSNSRREFLTIATAAAGTVAVPLLAGAAPNATGQNDMAKTGRANQLFKPEFQFGLGGVPLGNEFEVVTDEDAMKTMEASWSAGVRYFDVSPWYGLGLAERRYGAFLHEQQRDSYLISTKVGKLLKAAPRNNSKELFPYANSPNNVVFDYTADGVKRSLQGHAVGDEGEDVALGAESIIGRRVVGIHDSILRVAEVFIIPDLAYSALLDFCLALLIAFAISASAQTRIDSINTNFRWLGPDDKVIVERYDDPKVANVSCYMSRADTGGIKGGLGLAEDPSRFSIACRAVGPIAVPTGLPKSEVIAFASASLFFKTFQIHRAIDAEKNVLVYTVMSTKLINGSPFNSISVVPAGVR